MEKEECPKGMSIVIGNEEIRVFMQRHFWSHTYMESPLHKHKYTEVHIVLKGEVEYQAGERCERLLAGEMAVIPQEVMHSSRDLDGESKRITFQITKEVDDFQRLYLGCSTVAMLEESILRYQTRGESERLGACLTLVCSYVPGMSGYTIQSVQDYKYLIDQFFSRHYSEDISLKDISEALSVSDQHAIRLIKKYTNNNFRTELRNRRLESARYLQEHTSLSMEQIAVLVGYKSYNGLWRAMNVKDEQ